MKDLVLSGNDIKMDSREIAGLTRELSIEDKSVKAKRHSDICRDIRKQLLSLDIAESTFALGYLDKNNQKRTCYQLNYEQTMILVSGYSVKLRAKIIRRWNELEQNIKPKLPQSFSEALQLAADQAKQLEEQAPKVEFFDTVTKMDSWLTFKEVANILNIPELGRNNLTKKLRELKYINDYNKPFQRYIDQKLFKVIESKKGKKIFTSTVVSQKGLDRIMKVIKNEK